MHAHVQETLTICRIAIQSLHVHWGEKGRCLLFRAVEAGGTAVSFLQLLGTMVRSLQLLKPGSHGSPYL